MTTPPPPQGPGNGASSTRLEALRLAIQSYEYAPAVSNPRVEFNSDGAAAEAACLAILAIAERYRTFLEGEAS